MLPVVNLIAGGGVDVGEAAAYLRLPEQEVLRLVREQNPPGRQVDTDCRFFKRAIQECWSKPLSESHKEGIWAFAGAPGRTTLYAEEMIKEIQVQVCQPVQD